MGGITIAEEGGSLRGERPVAMTDRLDPSEESLPVEAPGSAELLPARPRSYGVSRTAVESEGIIDWRRSVAALLRYKWLILATTIVGLGLGAVVGRFIIKPLYVTQATIWIESAVGEQRGPEIAPIRQQQLLRSYSWVELLKSYLVLDYAVEELRLYLRPVHRADSAVFRDVRLGEPIWSGKYRLVVSQTGDSATLVARGDRVIERAAVGDSIGRSVGLLWAPPAAALQAGRAVAFSIETPRDAGRDLAEELMAGTDPNSNFLRVALRGTDPELVAATVNAVVERYVDVAAELKREKLTELARILDDQLRQAERNLRGAENALESFRVQTITLPSERATPVSPGLQLTRDPVFTNFFRMRIDLEQVRQDRDAIQRALAQGVGSSMPIEALGAVGAVQQSELMIALKELTDKRAELRALRYRYTEEHPPVERLSEAIETLERRTIPALSQMLVSELTAREAELASRIQSASLELRQIPPRVIQEARLDREVRIADNLFTVLQHRYEEARLAEVSTIPDVRILDKAPVPQQPVMDLAWQLLLGCLVGGLGVGMALAVLLDHFDRRVRYPDQVTAGMGLPILGAVPHLKGSSNGAGTLPVIEAFRGIQLNLVYAYGAAGPLVVTVTSPGARDGKSFVAANLALAFADVGYSTVLIDGDVRRGSLHGVMAAPRLPGLTDVLAGRVPWERATRETQFPLLRFVPSGTRMSRAPELLGSSAMTQLLTSLRGNYSVIILDSPPLGAGVDAYALSAATGNLLIALRTGATNREMAEAKLEVLDRLPVRILGAVLNDVRQGSVYGYYSYYMEGYEYEGEAGEGKKLLGSAR